MVFKEKLAFLMGLTETRNSQLANAIMVDPSLISRLRNGKRNVPSNAEYISSIAKYLASRCTTTLQRDALTRATEDFIDFSDTKKTTRQIESWLTSNDSISRLYGNILLQSFESATSPLREEFADETYPLNIRSNNNKQTVYAFYGNEGNQQATQLLSEIILSEKKASKIKIANGNNTEWLWKDRKFSEFVSYSIKKAVTQGHTITHVIPCDQNITMSLDSVNRWLPLYSTGQVNSYYYPYHRDRIFNRTLYVASGVAALVSTTVGNKTENCLTILTTNPDMVASLESEFNNYLELCLPATTFYDYEKSYEALYQCVSNFYKYQADCINIVGGLSYITTPKEVLLDFAQRSDNIRPLTIAQHYDSEYADIERLLQRHRYTEIFSIDSFEDIVSGKAKSCAINGEIFFYTPNAYITHLKNIIAMLEKYENYQVFLIKERTFESCIYVKNGYSVLTFLYKSPYSVCETKSLNIVDAVWEYAKRIMDHGVCDDINKMQVIMKINRLLLQLDDYVCKSQ